MLRVMFLFTVFFLQGCAQFGAKVSMSDGTIITEKAYIAQKQFEAELACHESRKISIPDNPTTEQVLAFAVASMASQNATPCSGKNGSDVAIAKTKARWGFAGSFARMIAGAYSIGEIADFGKVLANSRTNNTTYVTDLSGVNQSNSTSAVSEDALTTSESAPRTNTINIGGNTAVAGERAAAGQAALVNGDSSLQSFIEDSELKQSPLADDQNDLNNSNGDGFNDADGGNGVSLDF